MLRWLLRIWRPLPFPLKQAYLRLRYGWHGVGVAALIRDDSGRVLLVHRTYSNDEPWALPGGWLEGKEPIEQALARELLEETGLHVRVGRPAGVERAGFAIVLLMEAELLDPVAEFRPSAEVSELAWATLAEVRKLSGVNARLLRRALT
jgi:ADP-ribose pyrophosphatase YjhB (NUDIX family)